MDSGDIVELLHKETGMKYYRCTCGHLLAPRKAGSKTAVCLKCFMKWDLTPFDEE